MIPGAYAFLATRDTRPRGRIHILSSKVPAGRFFPSPHPHLDAGPAEIDLVARLEAHPPAVVGADVYGTPSPIDPGARRVLLSAQPPAPALGVPGNTGVLARDRRIDLSNLQEGHVIPPAHPAVRIGDLLQPAEVDAGGVELVDPLRGRPLEHRQLQEGPLACRDGGRGSGSLGDRGRGGRGLLFEVFDVEAAVTVAGVGLLVEDHLHGEAGGARAAALGEPGGDLLLEIPRLADDGLEADPLLRVGHQEMEAQAVVGVDPFPLARGHDVAPGVVEDRPPDLQRRGPPHPGLQQVAHPAQHVVHGCLTPELPAGWSGLPSEASPPGPLSTSWRGGIRHSRKAFPAGSSSPLSTKWGPGGEASEGMSFQSISRLLTAVV